MSAPALTESQLGILRHMLGINDRYRRPVPYRDHYCANQGDPKLMELERLGMVEKVQNRLASQYDAYQTTEAGREAAIASWRAMRPSREKWRYHAFLHARDACPDLTFREFLTAPEFAESRRRP